ncbi:hypothetical protein D7V95_10685 [bacterium J10(2018)]|nr:hypothetical protein D7V95_10685 [bacterium J10(2018)]
MAIQGKSKVNVRAGAFTGSAGAATHIPETAPSTDGLSPANIWQESLPDSTDVPVTRQTERGQCGREPDSTDVPVPRQTTECGSGLGD